ncbi:DNA damage-regulated autophagy modulator protein 1-like, partial [Centruroides sculpturatus]|uniref:DNA damage-regulated autophagy modulator protein 1-like n=1 Tax=Centruroides sculpturatus TaxID=218467 RepID=UPI000C6ECF33
MSALVSGSAELPNIVLGIAIHLNHVRSSVPYISDTGTTPPEYTLFGQMLNITSIFTGIIFLVLSLYLFDRPLKDIPLWTSDDKGYDYHIASTTSEWIFVSGVNIYTLTFYKDFQTIILILPT